MIYDFSWFAQPNRRGLTGINDPTAEFSFRIGTGAGARAGDRNVISAPATAARDALHFRAAEAGGEIVEIASGSNAAHRPRAHHASIESSGSTSGDGGTSGTDSGTDASPTDAATADDAASCDHRRDGAGRPPRSWCVTRRASTL